MENLSFVTLDTWTLIFTWVNLFILFLLVKKLFFKPMQKMLAERNAEIEADYSKARDAQEAADKMRKEYSVKIENAQSEASKIVSDAVESANMRSATIVRDAEEKASEIMERAQKNIEAQKTSAIKELKEEVSSMAVDIAKKIIERDIDEKDHEAIIDKALEGLGGLNG